MNFLCRCFLLLASVCMLTACDDSQSVMSNDEDSTIFNKPVVTKKQGGCFDDSETNTFLIGRDDPLSRYAWHLLNTGPNQVVSAAGDQAARNNANDDAVAGIDANVAAVHKQGRGCTGKGVRIAIIDSGLEVTHEDLIDNVVTNGSFNFMSLTDNPSPVSFMKNIDHGTGVAGIAGARGWNFKGSRGLAPMAELVGFPIVQVPGLKGNRALVAEMLAFGNVSLAKRANSNSFADEFGTMIDAFGQKAALVDVFNFSAGAEYPSPDKDIRSSSIKSFHESVKFAVSSLRFGRGAVVLQAAGNSFISPAFDPNLKCRTARLNLGGLSFSNSDALTCGSSNHEPYAKPYAYQVAAIHNNGRASSYSSAGSDIWITGFGGESGVNEPAIITTDNTGCFSGFNNTNASIFTKISQLMVDRMLADQKGENTDDVNCNYTGRMNGTSAAAPSVAGIVALMLEANPELTQQDVGYILAKTARKVDHDIANSARRPSVQRGASTLVLDRPWQINQAGFHFHNRYGFGLIDAYAAVKMAVSNYQTPKGRRSFKLKAQALAKISQPVGSFQVASTKANFIASSHVSGPIRLDIKIRNTDSSALHAGYLQFELVNKAGDVSILMPAFTHWFTNADSKINNGETRNFRFHTNAFYGEGLGEFTIRVILVGNQSFRIDDATLTSFSL